MLNNKKYDEYVLLFSKYQKNSNYHTYDVVLYQDQFFGGIDLFKNFGCYLAKLWQNPVTKLSNYEIAQEYFLSL